MEGPTDPPSVADRNFLFNLLDTLKSQYNINPKKIYSTGFSQGGLMSYLLACFQNMNFAAIASVSGGIKLTNYPICAPDRPTPVMEVHGTADPVAGYNGLNQINPSSPPSVPVDTLNEYWVNYNHCNPVPTMTTLPDISTSDNSTVEHYVWSGGDQGVSVEFYKVINGGHAWPADVATGGTVNHAGNGPMLVGNRNMDFNASKEIWRFFSKYSLEIPTDITEDDSSQKEISVYPNPSNGIFQVDVKNNQNVNITIVNVLGETVLEKKISDTSVTLDLSNAPAGVYFYQAVNKAGTIQSGKLIVQ